MRTPMEEILRRNGIFPEAEEKAYQEAKAKFVAEVRELNRIAKEAAEEASEEDSDCLSLMGLLYRGGKKGKNCS